MDQYHSRQQGIYQSFRDFMSADQPLAGSPEHHFDAGCLLIMSYGSQQSASLARISEQVSATLPAITYHTDTLHTTLATGAKLPSAQHSDDNARQLFSRYQRFFHQTAAPLIQAGLCRIRVELQGLLYNANSLIAAGEANAAFWELAEQLTKAAARHNLPLQMPWGSHVTLSRFQAGAHDRQTLDQIVADSQLPQQLQPQSLQLVWFECDQQGFRLVRNSH